MPYERYNFDNPQNTTLIDELKEPSDDSALVRPSVEKFIRIPHSTPAESGMYSRPQMHAHAPHQQAPRESYEDTTEHFAHCPCARCRGGGSKGGVSCPMVFEHISSCPVCQRIYASQSCDYRIYILIIVILLVLCILLFKKAFLN